MKKVMLLNKQSPGDLTVLTASVRDFVRTHGNNFQIGIHPEMHSQEIWEHNPYITKLDPMDPELEMFADPELNNAIMPYLRCEYPLIHTADQFPLHFIHGFARDMGKKLDAPFEITEFKGDIHLSADEKSWMSAVEEKGHLNNFWLMFAGGKQDFTCKWWAPQYYQSVVSHFKDRILFAQVGESGHWHQPLDDTLNLLGKTNLRQLVRLVYHSQGVIGPVSLGMHLAAAVPTKTDALRPCVVIAGGREPVHWEAYPGHQFLHTIGALSCCARKSCWKSRCQTIGDGDEKDTKNTCEKPVQVEKELAIPQCMNMISPQKVAAAIETYYEGGMLGYLP